LVIDLSIRKFVHVSSFYQIDLEIDAAPAQGWQGFTASFAEDVLEFRVLFREYDCGTVTIFNRAILNRSVDSNSFIDNGIPVKKVVERGRLFYFGVVEHRVTLQGRVKAEVGRAKVLYIGVVLITR
jgi:hypothetical protein